MNGILWRKWFDVQNFGFITFKITQHQLSVTVGWARATKAGRLVRFPVGSFRKTRKRYTHAYSGFVRGINGWVQGNGSRAVLLLTSHQCSIHCKAAAWHMEQASEMGAADHFCDSHERSTKAKLWLQNLVHPFKHRDNTNGLRCWRYFSIQYEWDSSVSLKL